MDTVNFTITRNQESKNHIAINNNYKKMMKYIKANQFFVDSFNFKTLTKKIKIKLQVKRAAVLSETDRNL